MPCKCHGKCVNERDAISGRSGGRFDKYNWCKTCEKWSLKPTPVRCYCCNQKFRTTVRCSKVKSLMEYKRIG